MLKALKEPLSRETELIVSPKASVKDILSGGTIRAMKKAAIKTRIVVTTKLVKKKKANAKKTAKSLKAHGMSAKRKSAY